MTKKPRRLRLHERNKTFCYGIVTAKGKIKVFTVRATRKEVFRLWSVQWNETVEKLVISRLEKNIK